MTIDSHNSLQFPGDLTAENRDNSRDIPVNASPRVDDAGILADLALDLVSDFYRIHRRKFDDRPRGASEVARARQIAVSMVLRAGVSEWEAAKVFSIDLSTVKNARDRVAARRGRDPGFAADFKNIETDFTARSGL